ncbi:gp53-like domain-containing protein [Paraburkholderia sediminicola]|uniref:gp53-like domain-containing protein n=1 Tax=Paraburkholderia sediminicola TaxID=458836 RepID=UPI0038B789BC
MPTENDFLAFAVGGSANVTSQTAYAANTTLTQGGFQSGIANSADLNKVWRQSSIMSAVLAQFIVARTGSPAIDDGTTATLLANLELSSAAVNGDSTKTFSVAPATASTHAVQFGQATNTTSPLALATTAATVANQAVNLGQLAASLASSGYLKIPVISGGVTRIFILQWVRNITATANGSGQATISAAFPITFPNAVLSYSYTPDNEFSSVGAQRIAAQSPTTSGQNVNIDGVTASGPCAISGLIVGY